MHQNALTQTRFPLRKGMKDFFFIIIFIIIINVTSHYLPINEFFIL